MTSSPIQHAPIQLAPIQLAVVNVIEGEPLGAVEQVIEQFAQLDGDVWTEVFGHGDFRRPVSTLTADLARQDRFDKRLLVALDRPGEPGSLVELTADSLIEGRVIGGCVLAHPRQENAHLVEDLEVVVAPEWRRQGVATAILTGVEVLARQWGAHTILGWGTHSSGEGRDDALRPSEGDYSIAPDRATALALGLGYHLAQCERHSAQEVPTEPVAVPEVPADYDLVTWTDHTPDDLVEQMCRLYEAMSADVPKGDLDILETKWDADKLTSQQAKLYQTYRGLTCAARHRESGALAGYTELRIDPAVPGVVWQDTTVVARDHRGHGLGRVLKWANLARCQQHWPDARRIHTWNAGENQWMLAINDELGYRVATVGAAWQKKLNE